jgi:pantoate--beta-alanine ligase
LNSVAHIAELRRVLADARGRGARIGFVPTMGYLHEGHLTLCDVARQHTDCVVLSVFVNPLQFGNGEDLDRYPRAVERDAERAAGRGVDVFFAPDTAEMYPAGRPAVRIGAPLLADRLCGAYRPGHFEGVLTVVALLFNIVGPDVAVFGQKDLQQAVLIRRMVQDLAFPIDVRIAPIVREADGLAMSSRNVYLDAAQRTAARALGRALRAAQDAFSGGATDVAALRAAARSILDREAGVSVQYVELVDVATLDTPAHARPGDAIAVAAHVGSTRLIDNRLLQQ